VTSQRRGLTLGREGQEKKFGKFMNHFEGLKVCIFINHFKVLLKKENLKKYKRFYLPSQNVITF